MGLKGASRATGLGSNGPRLNGRIVRCLCGGVCGRLIRVRFAAREARARVSGGVARSQFAAIPTRGEHASESGADRASRATPTHEPGLPPEAREAPTHEPAAAGSFCSTGGHGRASRGTGGTYPRARRRRGELPQHTPTHTHPQ